MTEPTKADLKAAVATLTKDNAALRDLLAAIRSYADIPNPADYAERTYPMEMENRLVVIAIYANADRDDMDQNVYPLVLADRAKELRERAARPVRYAVRVKKTAEPEPAPDDDESGESGEDGEDATVAVAASAEAERAAYTGHLRTPAIPAGPDDPHRLALAGPPYASEGIDGLRWDNMSSSGSTS